MKCRDSEGQRDVEHTLVKEIRKEECNLENDLPLQTKNKGWGAGVNRCVSGIMDHPSLIGGSNLASRSHAL